jgi:hypothetical protein
MRHNHNLIAILALIFVSPHAWASNYENLTGKEAFYQAITQIENGNHGAAIPLLLHSDSKLPDSPSVLWNLGISAIIAEEYSIAAETWSRFRRIEPDNWEVLPKLIQAYQGLSKFEERNNVRSELMGFYNDGEKSNLSEQSKYCREQYPIDGGRVFVYEYFKPFSMERIKFYEAFYVNKSGELLFSVSMGSYQSTNQIDLELGNHKEDERLYHFDIYSSEGTHETVGFYSASEPFSYDKASKVLKESVLSKLTRQEEAANQ